MTPFGKKVREHRDRRGMTMKEMAAGLSVSSAYLSALERGNRGRPVCLQGVMGVTAQPSGAPHAAGSPEADNRGGLMARTPPTTPTLSTKH